MSIAITSTGLSASPTWRRFQGTCIGVGLALGVGCTLYAVETLLLHSERRFVENPADTMTRAIGLAHFMIGWLFLFTSPRLRQRAALTRLTFWTLFGMAFCALFAWGGADKNPLLLLAFYGFFFIHEAYDEAFLFQTSGELADRSPNADRFLASLGRSMSLLFILLLTALQLVRGHVMARPGMAQPISLEWMYAGVAVIALLATGAMVVTVRCARAIYGSLREAIGLYQPLLAIYAALLVVLLVGSLFGSIGISLVILLHGMTWLVSTCQKLGEREVEATGLWSWFRQTPAGFLTLHIVVAGIALLLFGLRTHLWERTGLVCDLVSKTWFPYWGIMHIAMSFWRK